MIDEDIETHIRTQLAVAFPAMAEDQIVVRFPSGSFDHDESANKRRNNTGQWALGTEIISVEVHMASATKEDRFAAMRRFPRGVLTLTSGRSFQRFIRWIQADQIEVVGMKGLVIYLEYEHELFPS